MSLSGALANQSILVDTNLLVLLIVGRAKREYVEQHKRLREFTAEDYDLLEQSLSLAKGTLVSPYILSETSNLYRYAKPPRLSVFQESFCSFVLQSKEVSVSSHDMASHLAFKRFGATDTTCLGILEEFEDAVLLSTDAMLCLEAVRFGKTAVNFNHHRNVG